MGIVTVYAMQKLAEVKVESRGDGQGMVVLEYGESGTRTWNCYQMALSLPEMQRLEDALREYREQAEAQAVVDEMSLQFADLLEPSGVSA